MATIVLVHGFLGFDRLFGIEYFKGVADRLRQGKAAVWVSEDSSHAASGRLEGEPQAGVPVLPSGRASG